MSTSDKAPKATSVTARKASRKYRRRQIIPEGSRCAVCNNARLETLSRWGDRILCYECLCREQRRSTTEWHHWFGEAVAPDLVGQIPANTHRELEEAKRDWDPKVTQNPEKDPVLLMVSGLYVARDLAEVVRPLLPRAIAFLLRLHLELKRRHGPRWFEAIGVRQLSRPTGL